MSPEPFVVVEQAAKRYATDSGEVQALPPTSASFARGRLSAIVGVSGSGKSTLLRLLAVRELPSAGVVSIGGAHTTDVDVRRIRRDVVSFVAQRAADNLFPHLTLGEHGIGESELAVVGLHGRTGARAHELSGGELARAAVAAALARRTQVLVFDEPTAELDRASAATVLSALHAAAEAGAAVIVATHDPDAIAAADVVLELAAARPAHAAASLAPPTQEVVLSATGLSKSFGATRAVRDVSLAVHDGELAVVVGRSGSGKSTLLMLLAGWERPDAGTVTGGGAWRELAYVPQRFGLVPELDVRDNVGLPARLLGIDGRGEELLGELALAELAARFPHELSVGQQQRVAVARALSVDSRIVLLDEPTSHQDRASAELVWAAVRRAAACLVATHETDAASRAHTSWSMVDGRLETFA